MGKFCTTIVALLCLFTLSLARTSPADAVTNQDSSHLPESSRLPSDSANKEADASAAVLTSERFIEFTFRPINRHFPVRSKQPHLRNYQVHHPIAEIKETRNGVIEFYGKNSDSNIPEVHGGPQRIPSQSVRLHHHRRHRDQDSDSDEEDEARITRIRIKHQDHDRFNKEEKLNKHFRNRSKAEGKMEKNVVFIKSLHKFFGYYF